MAQYRFSTNIVSRGKGQSVVAKAAYNSRTALCDERTGQMKDYTRGRGLEFSGIFAPKNAPEWMLDRAKLWNAVELQEDSTTRRDTAQLARNVELNLPHELNADQRRQLVRDFVREQFVRKGMVADVAIHAPHGKGDERNYHAHILLTMREIDGDQFAAKKNRDWNSKELHQEWKEKWAAVGARYLANLAREYEKAGHIEDAQRMKIEAERYSYGHLSLKEQFREAARRGDKEHAKACDREPSQHLGPNVAAQERRGIETERGVSYSQTIEEQKLREELRDIEKQIAVEIEGQKQVGKNRGNTAPPAHRHDERKLREAQSEIRVSGNWGQRGPQNDDRQREIRDRAERMSTANELASVADESKKVVLDWVERRTMANEKAAERTRTRDS